MENKNYKRTLLIVFSVITIIVIGVVIYRNNRYIFEDENKVYKNNYFVEYSINGKVGVIRKDGQEVIHTIYSEIYIPNPEKDVFICLIDDDNYEIINAKGEKIFTEFNDVCAFLTSDGMIDLEKEVLRFEQDNKYGVLNLDGEIIVKPEYDSIESLKLKPGKLLVKKDGKYGVVDCKGNLVIPTEYYSITGDNYSTEEDGYTKTGYIIKEKTNEGIFSGYISSSGKTILKPEYESIQRIFNYNDKENIYLIEMKNGKKGVYKNKKQIIDNLYQSITYSSNSNILVAKTTKNYTFYNFDGRKILNNKYEDYSIVGNYISVLEDENHKLYDINGNFIANTSYKSIEATSNPNYFIIIDENNHYGIMNKSTIIKADYIDLKYAYGDYFIFTNEENKVGILNVWSGVVVEPEYDSILKIYNINALEAKKGNITDIYSKDVKKLFTISDAIVENVNEKYVVVYSNTEKIYLDEDGNEISNIKVFNNKLYSFKKDGKWGFRDKNGNTVIDCNYDMATELNEYGFAGILLNGKWGIVDEAGKVLLEPKYEIETYYFPSFIGTTYIEKTDTIHCIKLTE